MGHITVDYYKTTFLGIDPGDDTVVSRYIERATDIIDLMISPKLYSELETAEQEAVQKATAYQTEYFIENGDTFSETPGTGEKVGTWSTSGGGSAGKNISRIVSPMVAQVLSRAGLFYMGVEVIDATH